MRFSRFFKIGFAITRCPLCSMSAIDWFYCIRFSLIPSSLKIDRKTFKGIISDLHSTTFVIILPKLSYFEGRNFKKDIQYFCFPDRPIKCGDILNF